MRRGRVSDTAIYALIEKGRRTLSQWRSRRETVGLSDELSEGTG